MWSRSVKEGIKEFSELLVMIIRANEVHTTFSGQLIRRESEGCTLIEFLHRQFQRENHTDIAFKTAVMKTSGSFHKRGCKECQTLKADMDKILHLGQGVQIKLRQMAWLEEKHSSQEVGLINSKFPTMFRTIFCAVPFILLTRSLFWVLFWTVSKSFRR